MKTTLYRYFNSEGQLLYVGITGDNTKRQSQHRRNSFWFGEIASATFDHFDNREEALEAEAAAIRYEKPANNIQGIGGMRVLQSPYVHMVWLAGKPDEGHDETHKEFCEQYGRLFSNFDGQLPEANMVVALAMQFARVDAENAPNLTKCPLCVEAYKSEWFRDAFRKVKGYKK
jgi:hypothetical protein